MRPFEPAYQPRVREDTHLTRAPRRLGTTDLEISALGLGAWAIGGGDRPLIADKIGCTEQVDDWAHAAEVELSGDVLAEIADALELTGAGDGPHTPIDVAVARTAP